MFKASDFLIALDDGHGMQTAGKRTPVITELGRYIPENEFNSAVVKFMDEQLRFIGFRTLLVAPTDADTSLVSRTNSANTNGADAYCSIHYDAMGNVWSTAEGHSIFVYPGSSKSKKLAECIAEFLKQGTVQKWRGVREQDFHVLRETKMPCILSENGFMDNPREARLMIDPDFQKEVAKEHVQGICQYFGVTYKENKKEVAGVSEQKLNADQEKVRQEAMKLGITDGKNPFREVNQYYVWNALLPLARQIEELNTKLK